MIDDLQIIDMVILERLINVADLEEARRQQKRDGGDLYNILIENGFVDEEKTIVALAHLLSIPCVGLRKFQPDPEVTSLVPCAMAAQMRLIPLSVSRQSDPPTLYLAMANPIDIIALDEVGELTGFDVVGYLAGPLEIARTLERCYGQAIYQQKVESRGGMLARTSGRDPFAGPSVSQLMDLPTLEEMSRSVRSQSVEAPADEPPLDLGKTRKPSSWSGELSDIDSVDDEVELASVEEEEILELDLEGFSDSPASEIFGGNASRIFMSPEMLTEAGRRRIEEMEQQSSPSQLESSLGNATVLGRFKMIEEDEASAMAKAAVQRAVDRADSLDEVEIIEDDEDDGLFPHELTHHTIEILKVEFKAKSTQDVFEAAETRSLVLALIGALERSGLVSEAEVLSELASQKSAAD
jgi:hypothetical protein